MDSPIRLEMIQLKLGELDLDLLRCLSLLLLLPFNHLALDPEMEPDEGNHSTDEKETFAHVYGFDTTHAACSASYHDGKTRSVIDWL